jgi:nucleotide-binding universal stress UspA family protein
MRAAFLCAGCLATVSDDAQERAVVEGAKRLLELVSRSSRANADILSAGMTAAEQEQVFDVFLCHNSADKPEVRRLNEKLKARGVRTWLDEEQLCPGRPWQAELEQTIDSVRSAALLIGASGMGPWQNVEMRAFLDEFATRQCPVIPVSSRLHPRCPSFQSSSGR